MNRFAQHHLASVQGSESIHLRVFYRGDGTDDVPELLQVAAVTRTVAHANIERHVIRHCDPCDGGAQAVFQQAFLHAFALRQLQESVCGLVGGGAFFGNDGRWEIAQNSDRRVYDLKLNSVLRRSLFDLREIRIRR